MESVIYIIITLCVMICCAAWSFVNTKVNEYYLFQIDNGTNVGEIIELLKNNNVINIQNIYTQKGVLSDKVTESEIILSKNAYYSSTCSAYIAGFYTVGVSERFSSLLNIVALIFQLVSNIFAKLCFVFMFIGAIIIESKIVYLGAILFAVSIILQFIVAFINYKFIKNGQEIFEDNGFSGFDNSSSKAVILAYSFKDLCNNFNYIVKPLRVLVFGNKADVNNSVVNEYDEFTEHDLIKESKRRNKYFNNVVRAYKTFDDINQTSSFGTQNNKHTNDYTLRKKDDDNDRRRYRVR